MIRRAVVRRAIIYPQTNNEKNVEEFKHRLLLPPRLRPRNRTALAYHVIQHRSWATGLARCELHYMPNK